MRSLPYPPAPAHIAALDGAEDALRRALARRAFLPRPLAACGIRHAVALVRAERRNVAAVERRTIRSLALAA